MLVRPAERKDRPQLLDLIEGYFAFYRTPFARPKVEALLDLLGRDPGLGVQLVAEADGQLQGFASLYACLDTLVADRILVMNDLFVDPSLRSHGVGAALFDASLAYATAHGARRQAVFRLRRVAGGLARPFDVRRACSTLARSAAIRSLTPLPAVTSAVAGRAEAARPSINVFRRCR